MTDDLLRTYYQKLTCSIDRFCQSRHWQVKLWFLSLILLLVLTGSFFNFHYFDTQNWKAIEFQKYHLLQPLDFSDSHVEKMSFRLTIPILARLFSLNKYGLYMGQVVCCILFIWFSTRLAYQLLDSRANTFLFIISCLPCYFIVNGLYDVFGRPDMYPIFLLLLAVYVKHPLTILATTLLAVWCDERALINASWVYLYWSVYGKDVNSSTLYRSLWPNRYSGAVLVSGFVYVLVRTMLTYYYQIPPSTSDIGLAAVMTNFPYAALSIYAAFNALWLVVLAAGLMLAHRRHYGILTIALICLLVSTLVSVLVFDIDRSMAYSFPILFVSLLLLKDNVSQKTLQVFLSVILFMQLMKPITVWDSHFHYIPNLLLRCIEKILL